MTGKVKFYNETKGFGFIIEDTNGKELFFHRAGLYNGTKVSMNDRVEYEYGKNKKGSCAVQVEKV